MSVAESTPIVGVDFAVTLTFTYRTDLSVRIEREFTYRTAAGVEHRLDPEGDPVLLGPVLALARAEGREVIAWKSGALDISFADGGSITVGPGDQYEAWQVSGRDGFLIVSKPARSGLAVWSPREPPS